MPSLASAILEMRSSLAFCAISMSEAIYESFCCGTALCLILCARHYKGCAIARTLTEIKIQAARTCGEAPVEQCPVPPCSLRSGMMKIRAFLQEQSSGLTKGSYKRWCKMVKKILAFLGLSLFTW